VEDFNTVVLSLKFDRLFSVILHVDPVHCHFSCCLMQSMYGLGVLDIVDVIGFTKQVATVNRNTRSAERIWK